jgi:hypothetical protein
MVAGFTLEEKPRRRRRMDAMVAVLVLERF